MRDQLDGLLDEAARSEMTLRGALAFPCEREIACKDQRRIEMSFGLAMFPSRRARSRASVTPPGPPWPARAGHGPFPVMRADRAAR